MPGYITTNDHKYGFSLKQSGHMLILSGFSYEESESQKLMMQAKLSALEEKAYEIVGHPFSLISTDDIAQVMKLFL